MAQISQQLVGLPAARNVQDGALRGTIALRLVDAAVLSLRAAALLILLSPLLLAVLLLSA